MRAVLKFRFMLMLALAPAALLLASSASAGSLLFHADLSEIPPGKSPVPSFGTLDLNLSEDGMTGTFEFTLLLELIENPLTVAYIHSGLPGENGPIVELLFDLTGVDPPLDITGEHIVFSGGFVNGTLGTDLTNCGAGGPGTICPFYVNVSTELFPFPDGEIRGQLQVVPEPSTLLLLLAGISAVFAFRPRVS